MDETESLLVAWRARPDAERATALCRALGSRVATSPNHRRLLTEVAPEIAGRLGREVPLQLELANVCIAAGDMFLSDAVLKPLLAIAPNEPEVWRLLGEVFLRAGNAHDAETAFEGAIARGRRDVVTMRWHEKARGCRSIQESGGHPAVVAEITRWIASWGPLPAAKAPEVAPVRDDDSQLLTVVGEVPMDPEMTIVRAPDPVDLGATIVRQPAAADLADKNPDSERTHFYVKAPSEPPPAVAAAPFPAPPVPPAPVAPSPNDSRAGKAGEHDFLDEESVEVDVLKLPEGAALDEALEAMRARAGVIIEEPTGFYQAPPERKAAPDILELARKDALPDVAPHGTLMLAAVDEPPAPRKLGVPPPPPLPAPPPVESPSAIARRVESPSVSIPKPAQKPVESPSGVIIDPRVLAPEVGPESIGSMGLAATIAMPSFAGQEGETERVRALAPAPVAAVAAPKRGRGGIVVAVVVVVLGLAASAAWYLVRVRGFSIGHAPSAPSSELLG